MEREAKYIRDTVKLKLDRLVTSPLVRAHETATIVAQSFDLDLEISDLLKPGFGLKALGDLLSDSDSKSNIMVVGHEPDFSGTITKLIGGGNLIMRKGGLARIDLKSHKSARGELIWLLTPALMNA
jgi:phosphohistidine phosphatase